jgi:hypothetical protein
MRISAEGEETLLEWWSSVDGQDSRSRERVEQLMFDLDVESWGSWRKIRDYGGKNVHLFLLDQVSGRYLGALVELYYDGDPTKFDLVWIDNHLDIDLDTLP